MGIPILVTGGLGFIGGVVSRTLLDLGHDVRIVDDGRNAIADASIPESIVTRASIQSERMWKLLEAWKPRTILHFAASAFVGYGEQHPFEYVENNVSAFASFLSMVAGNLKDVRLVHSGSCSVYGAAGDLPVTEDRRPEPVSWYGRTKLMAESLAEAWRAQYGFQVVSFRYFNAVGSAFGIVERRRYEERILPRLFRALEGDTSFTINGREHRTADGTCVRDYVDVLDLAEAHVKAAVDPIDSGFINLGSGKGRSVLDVVRAVEGVTGKRVRIQYGPARAGDPPVAIASIEKAKAVLGWSPKGSLETAIEHAWEAWNTAKEH